MGQLFVSNSIQSGQTCSTPSPNITNITFSDSAYTSILSHSHIPPSTGRFKPAEELTSSFGGAKVNGEWTLSILESQRDAFNGVLLDWKIHFEIEYCTESIQWSKLSTHSNSCEQSFVSNGKLQFSSCPESCNNEDHSLFQKEIFKPRHLHTGMAVGNNVFVVGGFAHKQLEETWRFDYTSRKWTQLHGVHKRPLWHGQMAALTPFGMITHGGMKEVGQSQLEEQMLLYNPIDRNLSIIETEVV